MDATMRPLMPENKLILYVKKSTPTSAQNVVKVLMLVEALSISHHIQIIPSPKDEVWFHEINPLKMVPALEDIEVRNGKRLDVWESGACLMYLVEKFDTEGIWGGKDLWERTQVRNWVEMHSSGLGATAKFWLSLKTISTRPTNPINIGNTLDYVNENLKEQYKILNARLSKPKQRFIALGDRPTIADFANLPFANEKVAAMAGFDFAEWPRLKEWSEEVGKLDYVKKAWEIAGIFVLADE